MRGDALVALRDTGAATFVQIEDQRVTGFSINGQTIDITNKDSNQWRELIAGGSIRTCTINIEGVWTASTQQKAMRSNSMDGTHEDWQVDDSDAVLEGSFEVTSFEVSGGHDDEQTYSATLESADVPTVT